MSVEIFGIPELTKRLEDICTLRKGGRPIGRKAMSQAAQEIVKQARKAAPIGPDTRARRRLARKGIISTNKQKSAARVGVPMRQAAGRAIYTKPTAIPFRGPDGKRMSRTERIGFKAGFNAGKKKRAPHAHLVILGTKERQTKLGQRRGRIQRQNANRARIHRALALGAHNARVVLSRSLKELF